MRIEKYSSEQFAGTRDSAVEFSDGMNVVLGDNETGKSTMIAALFYALTMPSSFKLSTTEGKILRDRYFPSSSAKTIQAKVRFSEQGKDYEVEKVWDLSGRDTVTKLKEIGGDMLRGSEAENLLKSLLQYSPAIYDNLVFGRQSNQVQILEWCFKFFGQRSDTDVNAARQQIAAVLSAAGGISEDKFLAAIDEKMKKLGGRWDFDRDTPEKGRGFNNPWTKGKGTVIDAFYAYQRADQEYQNAVQAEAESARQSRELTRLQHEKKELEQSQKNLLEQRGAVDDFAKTKQLLAKSQDALRKAMEAQGAWTGLSDRISNGTTLRRLQQEAAKREKKNVLLDKLHVVSNLESEIASLKTRLDGSVDLPADYSKVKNLLSQLQTDKAQLTASRLRATIQLETGYSAQLRALDGSIRNIDGSEDVDVDGYVKLSIPGVAEICVAPRELDIEALEQSISVAQAALDEMLAKYQVSSIDELSALAESRKGIENDMKLKEQQLKIQLGKSDKVSIQVEADAISLNPALVIPNNLEAQIEDFLSGAPSLDATIASAQTTLDGYVRDYESQAVLSAKAEALQKEVDTYSVQIDDLSRRVNITAEEYIEKLDECKAQLDDIESSVGNLHRSLGALSVCEPAELAELRAEKERLESIWQATKRQYEGYVRIKTDFEELCAQADDCFSEFNAKFNQYLSIITAGKLSMEDDDTLLLKSGRNQVTTRELLSEGTKKTVLLAFRLAVLEYLFPGGGAMLVLDDDLLDMDPTRREQSARLLQKFAERNQIIFTTCDPTIAETLGGNLVRL